MPIPTQASFWSTFLRFSKSAKNRKRIEAFLFRYFLGYHKVPSRLAASNRRQLLNAADVEEVFTFLSERVRAPSTSTQLRAYAAKVWDSLVTEIGGVFTRFPPNKATRQVFRQLLDNHIRSRDVVVSFNYDTVFESSLPGSQRWAYDGIEDTTGALRILKPHGSVNWEAGSPIRRRASPKRSVVVAPTHLKFVSSSDAAGPVSLAGYLDQSSEIQLIWSSMERHMSQAKALVFIGYSFPVADLYFSSILRSVLADRSASPAVVVVNPDAVALAARLEARFAVPRISRYFDLAQFVQAGRSNVLKQVG
ncbi:MAG: SIR2 family protein [Acidobacteriota bacterium]